jgi:hypothetical protein
MTIYVKKNVLLIKNTGLAANQLKAIACTIPIISGLKEVKFENNGLMDDLMPVILMAVYMHPEISILSFNNNFLRQSSANTYAQLAMAYPTKITEINLMNAMQVGDHADSWTFRMEKMVSL